MLTPSASGAITSVGPSKVYRKNAERDSRIKNPVGTHSNYDSVTLSSSSGESRFRMALVGRLSQEVRTATTTGDINTLRQQVSSGTYTPDPAAIARRIMLMSEEN